MPRELRVWLVEARAAYRLARFTGQPRWLAAWLAVVLPHRGGARRA
jgi:hypothetical protein